MTALNTRLWRDWLHMRSQIAAVTLVVLCGIATFVTMFSAYSALVDTQAEYYQQYRFADLFASAKRAPESLAPRLRAIPGVAAIETRIVHDAMLDVPGLAEPAIGRLISIPPQPRSMLNGIYLRKGRYIEAGRREEVLASEAFATANRLQIGDRIGTVMNGRWEQLRIVGIALSPEYVYEIRGTEVLPDNKRFGVLWMSRDVLGPAYDMDSAFNDVSVELGPGANPAAVVSAIDRLLEAYGGRGAYDREEQTSHRFLTDEIAQDRVTGVFVPAIFLGVAAFLLHIVLTRLVNTQRAEIGVMKAFGYTNGEIAWSYAKFAIASVAVGAVAGVWVGGWLGQGLANMYGNFFRFPMLRFHVGWDLISAAGGISCGAAVIGALLAARRAALLPPAEAMRPESPPRFHAGILERWRIAMRLPISWRMILRNLDRRRAKAAMSVLGIAFAVAIVIIGRFFLDSIDRVLEIQFVHAMRQDVSLWLNEAAGPDARHAMDRLPGVRFGESFRLVPVRLRHEHRKRRLAIFGHQPDATLNRIIDRNLRQIPVPPEGLVMSQKLAETLGVAPGDLVTVEVLEGNRPVWNVPLASTVDDMIGLFAYMDIRALNRLMREDRVVSGSYLTADPARLPELYRAVKGTPGVAGILLLEAMKTSFLDTIAANLDTSTYTLVIFACVIAFGMVYNTGRISLSERGHELASLRVLGFTLPEVAFLLLGEQALLTLAAIPVGYVLGYAMAVLVVRAMEAELYRLPAIVSLNTYAFAFLIVAGAAACSAILILLRLRKLDLIAVLKSRD